MLRVLDGGTQVGSKILLGALALGLTFNASSADYTLKNLKEYTKIERLNEDEFILNSPIVKDYSEVKGIAEQVYKEITGESLEYKVHILDEARFENKKNESDVLALNSCSFTIGKEAYVRQSDLTFTLKCLGHELGHLSKKIFYYPINYNEMMIEEAKAIALM